MVRLDYTISSYNCIVSYLSSICKLDYKVVVVEVDVLVDVLVLVDVEVLVVVVLVEVVVVVVDVLVVVETAAYSH